MTFWSELRQRSVFRVAGGYAVVGWLLAQVAVVLEGAFGLPGWFDGVIVAALLLGFPAALLLAWAYELTPDGFRRVARDDGEAAGVRPPTLIDAGILAALLAVLGVAIVQVTRPEPSAAVAEADPERGAAPGPATAGVEPASIAVLAFADLSPEGDQEYFSLGIAEEILNVLAGVDGLRVASRTSSFAYRGQEAMGVSVIADQLEVRHVLEGSVRKAGDTIRITAQLVDAEEDRHLWSANFNRQLTTESIFAIQDEIANAIVEALREPLGFDGAALPTVERQADTASLDAYELYLEAHARFIARSASNVRESLRLAEQSVGLDPSFARGWATYAAVASVAPGWGLDDRDYRSLAIEAADTAIALQPSLALPYAALGEVHAYIDPKDFGLAMELLDQALVLDPDDATARLWRGEVLLYLGFFERADDDFEACLAVDPAYTFCRRNLAVSALFQGEDERALRQFTDAIVAGYPPIEPHIFGALLSEHGQDEALVVLIQNAVEFYVGLDEAPWMVEPLYRAVVDPGFDREQGLRRFEARLGAQSGATDGSASFTALYSTLFRAYGNVEPTVSPLHWLPELAAPEHAADRRRMIEHFDLPAYWRAHGFPPQCRPVGDADYACD